MVKHSAKAAPVYQQIPKRVQTQLAYLEDAMKKVLFTDDMQNSKWLCVEGRERNIADCRFVDAVCELLQDVQFQTIVDMTAGSGGLLLPLLREFGNAKGIGIDWCPHEINCLNYNAQQLGVNERCVSWRTGCTRVNFTCRLKTKHVSAEQCLSSDYDYTNTVVLIDAPWEKPLRLGSLLIKDVVVNLVGAGAGHILCECLCVILAAA